MISLNARLQLSYSLFTYAALIIIGTFISAFIPYSIMFLHILPHFLTQLSFIWIGIGYFLFNKDEKKREIKLIVLFLCAYGTISSILTLLAYIDFKTKFMPDKVSFILQILYILCSSLLIIGSYFMQELSKQHVKEKRNLISLSWAFMAGFILFFVYNLLNVIYPPSAYVISSSGENSLPFFVLSPPKIYYIQGVLNESQRAIFFTQSVVEISYLLFIITGIWKLRKIFLLLDNIPPELIEQVTMKNTEPSYVMLNTQDEEKDFSSAKTLSTEASKKKMFCIQCGVELDPDALYCEECGAKNPYRMDD